MDSHSTRGSKGDFDGIVVRLGDTAEEFVGSHEDRLEFVELHVFGEAGGGDLNQVSNLVLVTNPYPDVKGGLSIKSESRAGYWHECRERGGTKSCVDASLRDASTREQGETCGIKMEANDLGETRVKGPKAGERGGLSYSR